MESIHLRPVEVERDFGQLAALFSLVQDEPTTEPELVEDYQQHRERIICLSVAEDGQGRLMGFNWATRDRNHAAEAYFYVIVKPEQRSQGAGGRLYEDVEQAAAAASIHRLEINVRDSCPECRAFAERRGFTEVRHQIAMGLDLDAFDDRPYEEIIAGLKKQGFRFTSMEELGNTEEAQRRLYTLNDTAAFETQGAEGSHAWTDFADFQQRVCRADWYQPAGQKVVIDSASGDWAAMSAITRFKGQDYAYNLFTGVDKRYRGRKLGQAVKVTALRHAREVLGVHAVRTHHNTNNLPMLAIDRKLGYVVLPGDYIMEKKLE
jgi:GNAT superfamily N-acetyltransferase